MGGTTFIGKKIDKKWSKRLVDIRRHPLNRVGKPEPLKYDLAGYWSRRIDQEHRLVYQVIQDELLIYACRYHYEV